MGKVMLNILVTLDGFIDHTVMIADDEAVDYATELLNSVDAMLFGRVTYQLLGDYWPTAASDPSLSRSNLEFARKINSMPKFVISRTLTKVEWNNTRLVKGDLVEEVTRLKQSSDRGLLIAGSVLNNTLMQHDLIDEYRLLINPVLLGTGKPLFREDLPRIPLKLVEARTFRSGIVLVRYLPDRK